MTRPGLKVGLYHDDMEINIPGFWFATWYDVSISPNLALYNHVREQMPRMPLLRIINIWSLHQPCIVPIHGPLKIR